MLQPLSDDQKCETHILGKEREKEDVRERRGGMDVSLAVCEIHELREYRVYRTDVEM